MKTQFIRYEYNVSDKIVGSFTLKADADKTVVKKLKAKPVDVFEHDITTRGDDLD